MHMRSRVVFSRLALYLALLFALGATATALDALKDGGVHAHAVFDYIVVAVRSVMHSLADVWNAEVALLVTHRLLGMASD